MRRTGRSSVTTTQQHGDKGSAASRGRPAMRCSARHERASPVADGNSSPESWAAYHPEPLASGSRLIWAGEQHLFEGAERDGPGACGCPDRFSTRSSACPTGRRESSAAVASTNRQATSALAIASAESGASSTYSAAASTAGTSAHWPTVSRQCWRDVVGVHRQIEIELAEQPGEADDLRQAARTGLVSTASNVTALSERWAMPLPPTIG